MKSKRPAFQHLLVLFVSLLLAMILNAQASRGSDLDRVYSWCDVDKRTGC